MTKLANFCRIIGLVAALFSSSLTFANLADRPTWANTNDFEILMTAVGVSNHCRADTFSLWEEVNRYIRDQSASSHQSSNNSINEFQAASRLRARWNTIKELLQNSEMSQNSCFEPLSNFYAVMLSWYRSGQQDVLPLLLLHRQGQLKPISRLQRYNLGGQWIRVTQAANRDMRFVIMGAYDCESTTIYFDPYQTPGDLFATLTHEIGHLSRDKFSNLQTTELSLREYLLIDEAIAAMDASFIQRRDRTNSILTNFDFTFFNPHGAFASLFRELESEHAQDFGRFFRLVVQHRDLGPSRLNRIVSLVNSHYFRDAGQFGVHQINVDQTMQKVRSSNQFVSLVGNSLLGQTNLNNILTSQNTPYLFSNHARNPLQPQTKLRLEEFRNLIGSPSQTCKRISEESALGNLQGYLGEEVRNPSLRPNPVQPGNEGAKPSLTLRPCLRLSNGI